MKKMICAMALAFLLVACAPSTKEDYLERFKEFVTEVGENSSEYSDGQWESKQAEYEKFTGEWYDKFEKELTMEEQMTVGTYIASFNYYKGVSKAGKAFEKLGEQFEETIDNLGKEAEEGINDLGKKIEELGEELQN